MTDWKSFCAGAMFVAVACNGGFTSTSQVGDAHAQVGGRLVPYKLVGDDGTEQVLPGVFFDTELQTVCEFVDDPGTNRLGLCLPRGAYLFLNEGYADENCTLRVGRGMAPSNATYGFSGRTVPTEDVNPIVAQYLWDGGGSGSVLYDVIDELPPDSPIYYLRDGECVASGSVGEYGGAVVGSIIEAEPIAMRLRR